jgi:hypothetical protein
MSAPASVIQIEANRANSLLSTGPRSVHGKQASSRNAQSHGLTTRHALLPGEDPDEHQLHHRNYLARYQPQDPIDQALVVELADLNWRLRRVPAFEAQLLSVEVTRLTSDSELKPLIEPLRTDAEILALAFSRLVQSKVLPHLYSLEARLARRAEKLERRLENSRNAPEPPARIAQEQVVDRQNEANSNPVPAHKIGRNELCPCRSGLKFKRCCLNGPQPATTA